MSKSTDPSRRPAPEHRWIEGMRTEPVHVTVRTEWLYSDSLDAVVPEGRTRHPFARGGHVVASDLPDVGQSLRDHVYRAVSAFGDDKDLIVEVRLDRVEPTDAEVEALAVGMWKHSGEESRWDEVAETWLHLARMGLREMRAASAPTPNATNASKASNASEESL